MDFVWIYANKFSAYAKGFPFNELDYSIRSVRKNYQGEARCFVVGDDPGLDIIHLQGKPLVTYDPITNEPVNLDLLNKMDTIIQSDQINDEFVLMYDDIFILQPTTKEDLQITWGRQEVTNPAEYIKTRAGGTPYKKLWVSTYDYLVSFRMLKGLKTYDWETHLPRYLEKSRLNWINKTFNLRDIPKIPTSMYSAGVFTMSDDFNDEIPETQLVYPELQSDMWAHKPGMDFDFEFSCKYMNIFDDVIVPSFLDRMHERFGE